MADSRDNLLGISWHDSAWIPILNPANVMDYFMQPSNPFYDRTCNNEIVKMQRLSMEQLKNMTGLEYQLLHVQEPILYVIRKQHRHTPTQETPLANYHIIAGIAYQAPDLGSILNSRILSTVNHLQGAFDEARQYSRYHPSKGYWWEFKDSDTSREQEEESKKSKLVKDKFKEETSSLFQRQRVDVLLTDLVRKFPFKNPTVPLGNQPAVEAKPNAEELAKAEVKVEVKTEPQSAKMPPEKKPRLG